MPERILFPEFRDQYAPTRYPFEDTATLGASNSSATIDHDMFLDAALYPIGAVGYLYISAITIRGTAVTLVLSDSLRKERASASFDTTEPPEILRFTDAWDRPAGIMVATPESLVRFASWGEQTHQFRNTATTLATSCVVPTPEAGVRGVLSGLGALFTKDMWLVGQDGVVVRQDGEGIIRVDIVGDPLFNRKLCGAAELFSTPNFLRTINGCPPDDHGNFNLTVGNHENVETVMRIYPYNDGLRIEAVGKLTRQDN